MNPPLPLLPPCLVIQTYAMSQVSWSPTIPHPPNTWATRDSTCINDKWRQRFEILWNLVIYIYFICLASAGEILAVHCETHKVLLVSVSSKCPNLKIKKTHKLILNNIATTCFFVYNPGSNLTGKLSLTSHKRSVLSVDADASSLLDKNFT